MPSFRRRIAEGLPAIDFAWQPDLDSVGVGRFWTQGERDEKQDKERKCRRCRYEAELAERPDAGGLEIDQPAGIACHQRGENAEELPHPPVAERGEKGESECRKVSRRTTRRERDAVDLGVCTVEDHFTVKCRSARDGLGVVVMDGQVDRIDKAGNGDQRSRERQLR